MYEYQKNNRYFAQVATTITDLACRELSGLGARNVTLSYGGVYFNADKKTLYRINYASSLVSRILAPLASFTCTSTDQLYRHAREINWADIISLKNTFAVFSNVSKSKITNSHYASLRLKDGVADTFQEAVGKRPDVDPRNPDIWLNIHIHSDGAVISLDTSGGSLHRRGYRKESIAAPMQETVAAALIRYAEWDGSVPLNDPMCGSGTILSEALMHYCRIPPGIFRKQFGFQYLPDYDKALWENVRKTLDQNIREAPADLITGSDISLKAVKITENNLLSLPHGNRIKLEARDFRDTSGIKNSVIITNPPYGIRMGNRQQLDMIYKSFGDYLKQKCTGSTAYIYFGERELIKKIGLKAAWKKPLKTGGLDGRLVKYELF